MPNASLWDVADGGQLVFQNCESSVPMEVPAGSILIGRNKNIYCANPDIASASVITLPERVPVVPITGSTTIDAITGSNQYIGYLVTLVFSGALTLRDLSTGGNCRLAGGQNFVSSANDALTLTYDGATWIEVGRKRFRASPQVLDQSAVAASHTGDTTEATLATITIPAGLLGANGQIEIETLWSYPNSANIKTARVRFGGQAVLGVQATNTQSRQEYVRVANRNAANSQVSQSTASDGYGSLNAPVITTAVDTSADTNITITGQLASAAETITLESYRVVVWPKAQRSCAGRTEPTAANRSATNYDTLTLAYFPSGWVEVCRSVN